ncbi:tail tape measure protein [Escherichia coli]|nr:tail tape measure protein [Escherichia coli]HAX9063438.1 tape measure protein [Escherichia coli]HBA4315564.1 tape measure protein [Escherichia coli]
MATLRELIIKISANSQSFQSEIQRASRMGSEYYRTLQNGGRQAAAVAREQRRALAELNSQLTEIRASAAGTAGAFAGAFATGHLISLADEWSSVNARLKQASQSSDEFSSSQKVLMDISQRTGTAFSDNAALFARSAASMREYGYSADDVLKVTEAISTGLKISGASTAEAGSVITQFSQALAQGVLRGEEFNSVNESGDRIVRALAAGMGVARKDLKAMADDGKLTADKVVPALISQLGVLRDEYAAMPETVSDGITKVENAFMAWVGGANEASGATKTLSGVLNGVAGNIDNVATAAGALVAVGVARYFGNMASGAVSATAGLVTAARNEVALAEAQLRGTQIATARARAAVYRAQQAVAAARGTEMQIAAEARLAATQERLNRNIAARTAAQNALNSTTAVGSRLMTGALGLVGGVPGLVMLGAAAWYTLYQNQEQARESAHQYALTIDEIAHKTPSMSLPEASDNEGRTRAALAEQNRLIDEQASRVKSLQEKIAGYQYVLANPGWTTGDGFMINHLTSVKTVTEGLSQATEQLAVEQSRLAQMQEKAQSIHEPLGEGTVIHIVPRLAGAGKGGLQIVLGAAAIVGAFFTAGASMALWGSALAAGGFSATTMLFSLGASMILGGVAQMLAPKAKTPDYRATDNGRQNTYFSSLDNMIAQGNPMPVPYGEMLVGSRRISQDISTRDEGGDGKVVVIGRQG